MQVVRSKVRLGCAKMARACRNFVTCTLASIPRPCFCCYLGDETLRLFMRMVHSPSFPGNNFHVLSFLSHYQSEIFVTLVMRPYDYSCEWSTHPAFLAKIVMLEFPQPLSEIDLSNFSVMLILTSLTHFQGYSGVGKN